MGAELARLLRERERERAAGKARREAAIGHPLEALRPRARAGAQEERRDERPVHDEVGITLNLRGIGWSYGCGGR